MLVLSRKIGEVVWVSDNIKITVVDISPCGRKVRLGFDAPREIEILREELILPPNLTPTKS